MGLVDGSIGSGLRLRGRGRGFGAWMRLLGGGLGGVSGDKGEGGGRDEFVGYGRWGWGWIYGGETWGSNSELNMDVSDTRS